jgi:hypothetical protein
MKKLILAAITTACAVSTFAQGTVVFNNAVSGILSTRVYGPQGPGPERFQSIIGNRSTDLPAGTASGYTGPLLGATGTPNGTNYLAQLLGAPLYNQPESSLVPAAGGTTYFRSGGAAGVVLSGGATFNNIPQNAPQGTLEMVAWDNSSGLYGTWALASTAWKQGLIAAGVSGTWNQDNFGGTQPAPNLINSTDPTQSLHTFNLYFIQVPEPTSAALLGLGAAAMLIFRRRK